MRGLLIAGGEEEAKLSQKAKEGASYPGSDLLGGPEAVQKWPLMRETAGLLWGCTEAQQDPREMRRPVSAGTTRTTASGQDLEGGGFTGLQHARTGQLTSSNPAEFRGHLQK